MVTSEWSRHWLNRPSYQRSPPNPPTPAGFWRCQQHLVDWTINGVSVNYWLIRFTLSFHQKLAQDTLEPGWTDTCLSFFLGHLVVLSFTSHLSQNGQSVPVWGSPQKGLQGEGLCSWWGMSRDRGPWASGCPLWKPYWPGSPIKSL